MRHGKWRFPVAWAAARRRLVLVEQLYSLQYSIRIQYSISRLLNNVIGLEYMTWAHHEHVRNLKTTEKKANLFWWHAFLPSNNFLWPDTSYWLHCHRVGKEIFWILSEKLYILITIISTVRYKNASTEISTMNSLLV